MDALYLLLLFPLLWPLIARLIWHNAISLSEMGLNIGIVALAVSLVWLGGRGLKAHDTEIWNGQVIRKAQTWTTCEHSYSCNCREVCSGSGKEKSCSEECDTCYDHSNDWNWTVYTDIGSFNIARVDRQGLHEPSRWTKVQAGQPVARERSFANYIKAAPDSLFHKNSSIKQEYAKVLPKYPSVYDYHYADRALAVGVKVPDIADWNAKLALTLRALGPKKQANVIIVFAGFSANTFADALDEHWLGGKKNDIIVVLGTPEYPNVSWVRILSWTDKEIFKVTLRDSLLDLKTLDAEKTVALIERHVNESFVRRPMADFDYLWYEVRPSGWVTGIALVIAIFGSLGLTLVFRKTEI